MWWVKGFFGFLWTFLLWLELTLIVNLPGLRSTQEMWSWFLGLSMRTFWRGAFKGRRPSGGLETWISEWRAEGQSHRARHLFAPSTLDAMVWGAPPIWSSHLQGLWKGVPRTPLPFRRFLPGVCGQVTGKLASTRETSFNSFRGWCWELISETCQHPLCPWATAPVSSF